VELVNTYVPLTPLDEGLHMENDEVHIADSGEQGVAIVLRPTAAAASALLARAGVGVGASGRPELKISAAQGHAFGWMPAGSEAATQPDGTPSVPVIHRPAMAGSIAQWRGAEQHGYGYSKRYAAIYARYNAWRFIHGVATPASDSTFGAPTPPSIVWTADATFGDDKYNYYKLLPAERHAAGELTESVSSDTYNQADAVRAPPPPRTLPPRTLPPRTLPPRTLPPRTLPPRTPARTHPPRLSTPPLCGPPSPPLSSVTAVAAARADALTHPIRCTGLRDHRGRAPLGVTRGGRQVAHHHQRRLGRLDGGQVREPPVQAHAACGRRAAAHRPRIQRAVHGHAVVMPHLAVGCCAGHAPWRRVTSHDWPMSEGVMHGAWCGLRRIAVSPLLLPFLRGSRFLWVWRFFQFHVLRNAMFDP
jgi:hypothetical protein